MIHVGTTTSTTMTITLPANQAGDLALMWVARTGSTGYAMPEGWDLIDYSDNPSARLIAKEITAPITSVTVANYPFLIASIFRPETGGSLSVGAAADGGSQFNDPIIYPGLTFEAESGEISHVYSVGVALNADSALSANPPNGSTLLGSVSGSMLIAAFMKSIVASWSAANINIGGTTSTRRNGFAAEIIEITGTSSRPSLLIAAL